MQRHFTSNFLEIFYVLYKSLKIWNKQTLLLACACMCIFLIKNILFSDVTSFRFIKKMLKWQQVCKKSLKLSKNLKNCFETKHCVEMWQNILPKTNPFKFGNFFQIFFWGSSIFLLKLWGQNFAKQLLV